MIKKIAIICFCAVSYFIKAETIIENEKIIVKPEENKDIVIKIWETEREMLRINVLKERFEPEKNKFFLEIKNSGKTPEKTDNGYFIGKYEIKEEPKGYTVIRNGEKLYTSVFEIDKNENIQEVKNCYNKEIFYGMGPVSDRVSLENTSYEIYNHSEYGDRAMLYIPFYFTSGGDAFYYNAHPKDKFKFRRKEMAEKNYSTTENYIDYYFFYEKDFKKIVSSFYDFTNSKSMLPKWAFGYIQSKYGYENPKEVYELVENFKKYKIPLNAIVLDLQWFKKMGDLWWNTEVWTDYKEMDKLLEANGIKLITISEPFFTVDSKNYKEFEENGLFAKNKKGEIVKWGDWWCFDSEGGSIMNPIAKNAKEIIGKKYIEMKESGIDGFWTDLGEPENTPPNAYFNQYTEKEFHNYYNREWSKLIYETMREKYPDDRIFIMSRSGFTGSPRYNLSTWSGDVSATFGGLKKQIAIGINAGMTGFSYWGSDVGGFESNREKPDRELFIRWMQFGAFSPIFRAHGAMSPREPWIYDDEATSIIKKYIDLRYKLNPYIYSTAYETYKNGLPMMRPMFSEEINNDKLLTENYQYYFGDFIMTAPIVQSMNKGKTRKVFFPEGKWYNIFTFEKYEEKEKEFDVKIDDIPVFFKEGAIVPMEGELLIIPSEKESKYTWYNDDGITNNYEKGEYERIEIALTKDKIVFTGVETDRVIKIKALKENIKINKIKDFKEDEKFIYIDTELKKGTQVFYF